jgi:hypothetical protein
MPHMYTSPTFYVAIAFLIWWVMTSGFTWTVIHNPPAAAHNPHNGYPPPLDLLYGAGRCRSFTGTPTSSFNSKASSLQLSVYPPPPPPMLTVSDLALAMTFIYAVNTLEKSESSKATKGRKDDKDEKEQSSTVRAPPPPLFARTWPSSPVRLLFSSFLCS